MRHQRRRQMSVGPAIVTGGERRLRLSPRERGRSETLLSMGEWHGKTCAFFAGFGCGSSETPGFPEIIYFRRGRESENGTCANFVLGPFPRAESRWAGARGRLREGLNSVRLKIAEGRRGRAVDESTHSASLAASAPAGVIGYRRRRTPVRGRLCQPAMAGIEVAMTVAAERVVVEPIVVVVEADRGMA